MTRLEQGALRQVFLRHVGFGLGMGAVVGCLAAPLLAFAWSLGAWLGLLVLLLFVAPELVLKLFLLPIQFWKVLILASEPDVFGTWMEVAPRRLASWTGRLTGVLTGAVATWHAMGVVWP